MDTYEKWFDKMEVEKEQTETDETKKLNNKEEEEARHFFNQLPLSKGISQFLYN